MTNVIITRSAFDLLELRSIKVFKVLGDLEFDYTFVCPIAPGDVKAYVTYFGNNEFKCRPYTTNLHFSLEYQARQKLEEKIIELTQSLMWKVGLSHDKRIVLREDNVCFD